MVAIRFAGAPARSADETFKKTMPGIAGRNTVQYIGCPPQLPAT
ncbi:hypothetical protein [Aromatoleum toluclasticum]|nr:hypothetical protein [Aromatoleum toluclasticum]